MGIAGRDIVAGQGIFLVCYSSILIYDLIEMKSKKGT